MASGGTSQEVTDIHGFLRVASPAGSGPFSPFQSRQINIGGGIAGARALGDRRRSREKKAEGRSQKGEGG
jgi:hypothetical protein